MIYQILREAWISISAYKLRTFLTMLGIVIGPFGIIGILAGPFLGAYIGEKMGGTNDDLAWRSAIGSFIGFLTGTLMKIIYTLVVGFYVIKDICVAVFN